MSNTKKTTTTPATTTVAKKVTKRSMSLVIFGDMLAKHATLGDKAFRKEVLAQIMEKTECTLACAAAMYNLAKIYHVKAGNTPDFSRSAKKAAAEAAIAALARKDGDNWELVDKESGAILGFFATRKLGNAVKTDTSKVQKIA